ncbi:MAG: hypothetical protein K0Q79_2426 [Flavipsychrobacter sp.]|jgi:hypothetical protein|nr:hypothetical protein [Flavipsychrobacter sp.]
MKQYNIIYSKDLPVFLTVIIVPLLFVPAFLAIAYIPNLSQATIFSAVVAIMIASIVLTRAVIKVVMPKGMLTLNEDGFVIEFPNKGIFTPGSFEVKFTDILKLYERQKKDIPYLRIITILNPAKFNIEPISRDKDERASFRELTIELSIAVNSKLN